MADHTNRVAAVVIPKTSDEKKFLIAKRADNGNWEFPGGKEDLEKELDQEKGILGTAEREIKEEFNLEIKAQEYREDCSYKTGGYEIIPVYAIHSYENIDQHLKLVDHDKYRWIDPENLPENIELKNEKKCLKAFNLL